MWAKKSATGSTARRSVLNVFNRLYHRQFSALLSRGVVLNFSNHSFAQLIAGSVGVRIYDERYGDGGA
jgi:hypothetical protein